MGSQSEGPHSLTIKGCRNPSSSQANKHVEGQRRPSDGSRTVIPLKLLNTGVRTTNLLPVRTRHAEWWDHLSGNKAQGLVRTTELSRYCLKAVRRR